MDYADISKTGDREINEDSIALLNMDDRTVFIVADGLGGHGYGEIASKEAVETVKTFMQDNPGGNVRKLVEEAFRKAHARLKDLQREVQNSSFFKTTMVILVVGEDYTVWGSVGDSRIYHFEQGVLIERSMDNSIPQVLLNSGEITDSQIRYHEDRNRLTKVLGYDEEDIEPFVTMMEPRNRGAAFIMCTDGIWEHVTEKQMTRYLMRSTTCRDCLSRMEKTVLKKRKKHRLDNYSAFVIRL